MNKIIIFFFLVVLSIQSNDAFDPEIWETNARSFAFQVIDDVTNVCWDMKYQTCKYVTFSSAVQEVDKILKKFENCDEEEHCYFEKESIFHQNLERIRAEGHLCCTPECSKLLSVNKNPTFVPLCINDHDREMRAKRISDCTYLSIIMKTLAFGVQPDTDTDVNEDPFEKIPCATLAQKKSKDIRYETIDALRFCQKSMNSTLIETFRRTKQCPPGDKITLEDMIGCCKEPRRIYKETMLKVNADYVECYKQDDK